MNNFQVDEAFSLDLSEIEDSENEIRAKARTYESSKRTIYSLSGKFQNTQPIVHDEKVYFLRTSKIILISESNFKLLFLKFLY
jgi:hypothetical protein